MKARYVELQCTSHFSFLHMVLTKDDTKAREAMAKAAIADQTKPDDRIRWVQNDPRPKFQVMGHDTGLVDRGNEGGGAAVHDRSFGTVDLDGGVVDAHATQRSKDVLGGGNHRAFAVAQDGCKFGRDD